MPHRKYAIIKGFRAKTVGQLLCLGAIPTALALVAPLLKTDSGSGIHITLVLLFIASLGIFLAALLYAVLRLQPCCEECGQRMRKSVPVEDEEGHWSVANCLQCRRFFRYRGFGDGFGW